MNTLLEIQKLATAVVKYDSKAVGEVIDHYNAEGVYVRSMRLPAQRVILSHVHRYSCVSIMMQGEMILYSDDKTSRRVKGPSIFESKAGIRRAAYTITPIWFVTAHGTGHIPNWVTPNKQMEDEMIKRMISCLTQEEYQEFLETRSQYGQIQDLRT